MKPEHISDALNTLPDEMIEETHRLRQRAKARLRNRRILAAATAASLALFGYTGLSSARPGGLIPETQFPETSGISLALSKEELTAPASLPELPSLSSDTPVWGDGSFEGLMAYDISELVNANPWTEDAAPSTLPVYRNTLQYDDSWNVTNADWAQMKALLLQTAEGLGLPADALIIKKEDAEPYYLHLSASWEDVNIQVFPNLTAEISFSTGRSLPEKYSFSYQSSYEELALSARYLETEYASLLSMEEPALNLHGGDYTIELERRFHIEFFDKTGDMENQILNYHFNRVAFSCDDDGNLSLARVFQPDLSDKLGDYPIISAGQALTLLEEGEYFTSVPYEMPGLAYVAGVELIYRAGDYETYFMPFYRFYVELPEETSEDGMKVFGVYYVRAVYGEYFS